MPASAEPRVALYFDFDNIVISRNDESRVHRDANTASLIGSLDSSDEFFFVGYAATYVCPVDGWLSLGINDNNLEGNHGDFWASITVTKAE